MLTSPRISTTTTATITRMASMLKTVAIGFTFLRTACPAGMR